MAGVTTLSPAMQAGWVGVLLGVSIIVAAAGYYCIEEPARQWLRRRFLRQPSESLRAQESVFSSTS